MNKKQLFGRKAQMLRSRDNYAKWKLRLCVRLLDALSEIYFHDNNPERGPADAEARSAARAVISSKYLMERIDWRNSCEQKAAHNAVSQFGTRE